MEEQDKVIEAQEKELEELYSQFEQETASDPEETAAPETPAEQPADTAGEAPAEASTETQTAPDTQPAAKAPEADYEKELERWKKRYRDIQSWDTKLAQENAALKRRQEQLEKQTQLLAKMIKEAPETTSEAWQELTEEFPELGEMLPKAVEEKLESKLAPLKAELDPIKEQLEELRRERILNDQRRLEEAIVSVHSDFEDIKSSRYFHQWINSDGEGPNDLTRVQKQAILQSTSPTDAIRLLTQFKEEFKRNVLSKNQRELVEQGVTKREVAEATAEPKGTHNALTMPVKQKTGIDLSRLSTMSNEEFEKNRDALYARAQEMLKESVLV